MIRALISDFTQLARVGRLFGVLMPGLDVKPLLQIAQAVDLARFAPEAQRAAIAIRRVGAHHRKQ